MIEKVGLEQRRRGGIEEGKVIKAAACQDQDPQILLLHFTCTEEEERFVWKAEKTAKAFHIARRQCQRMFASQGCRTSFERDEDQKLLRVEWGTNRWRDGCIACPIIDQRAALIFSPYQLGARSACARTQILKMPCFPLFLFHALACYQKCHILFFTYVYNWLACSYFPSLKDHTKQLVVAVGVVFLGVVVLLQLLTLR